MKSLLVDKRDTNRENGNPVFRLFLDEPVNGAAAACDVREARTDDEVLAWADEQAAGRGGQLPWWWRNGKTRSALDLRDRLRLPR